MPSCNAPRISAFFAARALARTCSPRQRSSASKRWQSPTATAPLASSVPMRPLRPRVCATTESPRAMPRNLPQDGRKAKAPMPMPSAAASRSTTGLGNVQEVCKGRDGGSASARRAVFLTALASDLAQDTVGRRLGDIGRFNKALPACPQGLKSAQHGAVREAAAILTRPRSLPIYRKPAPTPRQGSDAPQDGEERRSLDGRPYPELRLVAHFDRT